MWGIGNTELVPHCLKTWKLHFFFLVCFSLCKEMKLCLKWTLIASLETNENAAAAAAAAKSLQSCPTLCDPRDGSPSGSAIPGILQARTLEWVVSSFSNAWKWNVKGKSFSCVRLLATPWTAAHQTSPSMGFSGQEYWSGVSLPHHVCRWGYSTSWLRQKMLEWISVHRSHSRIKSVILKIDRS